MNGIVRHNGFRRFGFVAVLLLSAVSLKADPIAVGEGPPQLGVVVPIVLAILLEAICILLVLRRWRRPAVFILWLLAMHLLTYPFFLGLLWLSYGLHPALGVTLAEGAIVLVEGGLIWLICRFLSSTKSELPVPSIARSLFASLIGNICSAAAFPLLLAVYGRIVYSLLSSNLD
jgi:hypothetical protein